MAGVREKGRNEMDNYICINGKKTELTEEQMRQLGIEPPKVDPFDVKHGDNYYHLDSCSDVVENKFISGWESDVARLKVSNACKDRKLMEQRAMHETLSRLLWRFAMQNGGVPDWHCRYYYIYLGVSGRYEVFAVSCVAGLCYPGFQRFSSKEIAQRAIDEIVNPFLAEHPDFVW